MWPLSTERLRADFANDGWPSTGWYWQWTRATLQSREMTITHCFPLMTVKCYQYLMNVLFKQLSYALLTFLFYFPAPTH